MTYGIIGLGNMATAIISGMRASQTFANQTIVGYDPLCEKAKAVAGAYGITRVASEREVVELSDVVLLAVKPQILPTLLPTIAPYVKAGTLVVSIAAGKTIAFYEDHLPCGTPVVRVMPNINAQVLSSATAICGGTYASDTHVNLVKDLFETVGQVFVIEEHLFSAFTGISGSAVAFAYLYVDAVAKAGAAAGFDLDTARKISTAATLGSAQLLTQSDHTPEELVKMVCSPGGTTIEGVASLEGDDFAGTLARAVHAVIQKDQKLQH